MSKELMMVDAGAKAAREPIIYALLTATQAGLPVESLEKFMDLAERNERREAEKAYHRAFARFKSDPPKIVKDSLVDYVFNGKRTTYKHASIGNVVSAIISGMSKHGLSHSWNISQQGSAISVTCKITHELGHSESTTLSAAPDQTGGKNSIQAISSTVTYLERYTLQAITGIAVLEDDNDGSGMKGLSSEDEKTGIADDPDRVAQWTDYLQKHTSENLDNFQRNYKEYLVPKLNTFSESDQNELDIVYKEMLIFLKEKEAKQ